MEGGGGGWASGFGVACAPGLARMRAPALPLPCGAHTAIGSTRGSKAHIKPQSGFRACSHSIRNPIEATRSSISSPPSRGPSPPHAARNRRSITLAPGEGTRSFHLPRRVPHNPRLVLRRNDGPGALDSIQHCDRTTIRPALMRQSKGIKNTSSNASEALSMLTPFERNLKVVGLMVGWSGLVLMRIVGQSC